jgi:peptide/nickel transport system ATP-binding protein
MTASRETVVTVEDLHISFSGYPVVRGVGFHIDAGETLAVVGESGSGKTVTSLAMMRLLPERIAKTTGRIRIQDRDILALSEPEMQQVRGKTASMIFQEPMMSLNPILTAGFQVKEVLRHHMAMSNSQAEAEALRLLDRVRIPDPRRRLNEYPHTFSGGMRQRIMIAIALACQPKLLIADEPTTALDVTIQAQILDLLRELQRESGAAILFVTHDMGVVADIADRVLVMRDGRAIESNAVHEIFRNPQNEYTRILIGAVPKLGDMRGHAGPRKFGTVDAVPITNCEARPAAAGNPLLEVKDLVARFPIRGGLFSRTVGHVHAVENVSFTIGRGETLAFVGESGCGKSTTGRSILGLTEHRAGRIVFDGMDILADRKRSLPLLRRKAQMIFQDPLGSLDPRQKIGSVVAEPILCHRLASPAEARDRANFLLERVGLDPKMASRLPHEFSGGQRQRICIARALALEPKLVIADEAVSALDVSVKAQVVDLLLDLQEEFGLSYLFISHDMAIVERISHRIAVMYLGEIVEIGPRAAVIEGPRHPYTRKLLSAVPTPVPSRSRERKPLGVAEDLPSSVRPLGYEPRPQQYQEVGPGHFIQDPAA